MLTNDRGLRAWIESLDGAVLRSLTAHAPDAIFVLDLQERIQFINWAAGGLTIDGVIGTLVYDYVRVEEQALMRECFEAVRRTHKPGSYQNRYINPVDGSVSFWESRVAPVLQDGAAIGLVVISSDVTERRADAAQRELLFSLSLDMLCIAGFDGYFKRINPAFWKTLQYSSEELLGKPYIEFVHPDDVASTIAATRALEGGQDIVDFENRYRRRDGRYRTLSWRSTSEPVSGLIFAVARDVTERRALELQLRQSQKMEAIGQLAGGLAHDFNNLLLAIMVNTQSVQRSLGPDHGLAEQLTDISRASQRASDLVKQLLALGRRRPSHIVPLELNRALSELSTLVRRLIPENIDLSLLSAAEAMVVNADPAQLEQVLLNLCLNARDAMLDGGRLTISTEALWVAEGTHSQLGLRPGSYAAIHVSDTGTGIAPEFLDRIFEPFFTTKAPGQGTGLGLATAYTIIEQQCGVLHFESELGVGSKFSAYLPLSQSAEAERSEARDRSPRSGHGTVLVAEDEDLVRSAVTMILQSAGYTVLGARDGLEALEILDAGANVRLVLLDIVMPKLGGPATLARIRERWPDLKVILSSGYKEGRTIGTVPHEVPLLEKPYRAEDLLKLLDQELSTELRN